MKRFSSWEEVGRSFKKIVIDILGVSEDEITLDASFMEDLGADSLDMTELLIACEDEFDFNIPDEDVEHFWTVRSVIMYIDNHVEIGPEPNEPPKGDQGESVYLKFLAFRIRDDGSVEVRLQATDDSWYYADGVSRLPSGIYVATLGRIADLLGELEALINSPRVAEQDLQSFFERHPDLLQGGDYEEVIPQAAIRTEEGIDWRADFILKPFDQTGFCKILELKLPSLPVLRNEKNGHPRFYSNLLSAVSQLKDYGEAFLSPRTRERFQQRYQVDVYKPDLQLIAGRAKALTKVRSVQNLQRSAGVQIVDWDTHLKSLKRKFL